MKKNTAIITTPNGFRVQGDVSFDRAVALRVEGEAYLAAFFADTTVKNCVIDLSGMQEKDASPFSVLLCWMRFVRHHQRAVQFVNLSPSLQRMKNLFGLTALFSEFS